MNDDDDPIAALIRAAGKRPNPDAAVRERVRAAVEGEWRAARRRRRVRRWSIGAFAAAAVMAVILVVVPRQPSTIGPPEGKVIETSASTRSLEWGGNTLRLDANTRVVLLSDTDARLESGRLYFSSGRGTAPVTIRTRFGDVRDIGTQFEVQLSTTSVTVRVREGRIELRGQLAGAGEMLLANEAGVTRHVDDSNWSWVEEAAPPVRLEGMRLDEVVYLVAREKGLTPLWRVPASSREIVLHGDVELRPEEALDAATAATGTQWSVDGQTLVIEVRR